MKKIFAIVAVLGFLLTPLSSVSAAPLVKLISPNGGEKYVAGKSTMQVKWSSSLPKESQINGIIYKLKSAEWDPTGDFYTQIENSYPVYFDTYNNTGSASWKVPFDQAPGYYALEFSVNYSEQYSNQYGVAHSAKPFRIEAGSPSGLAPQIENVQPNPAFPADKVTVTGSGFKNNVQVFLKPLGGDSYSSMPVSNFKTSGGSTLTFIVDQYITAGSYDLYLQNNNGMSAPVAFVVAQPTSNPFPHLDSISPASGVAGTTVTITGGNFTEENDVSYYLNDYYPVPYAADDTTADDSKYAVPQNTSGIIPAVKSQDGMSLQFQLPTEMTTIGNYTFNVSNTKGYSDEVFFTLVDPSAQGVHPAGTNVKGPDGVVYFIDNGGTTRTPYTSSSVFLSYKFNSWSSVVPATTADMELPLTKFVPLGASEERTAFVTPRNGSLFKDKGTVYLITNGQRIPFASAKVFSAAGYSFANVQQADTSFMVTLIPLNNGESAHPDGTLVNDKGTIYVMKNGYRMGFPSMSSFTSWGFSPSEIVPANANDLKVPQSGIVGKRSPRDLNI